MAKEVQVSPVISARAKAGWEKRHALYGPSGGNVGSKSWPMSRRKHGAYATYYDGCRCILCVTTNAMRAAKHTIITSWQQTACNLLPPNFDDDARLDAATLQSHPPRAWVVV